MKLNFFKKIYKGHDDSINTCYVASTGKESISFLIQSTSEGQIDLGALSTHSTYPINGGQSPCPECDCLLENQEVTCYGDFNFGEGRLLYTRAGGPKATDKTIWAELTRVFAEKFPVEHPYLGEGI